MEKIEHLVEERVGLGGRSLALDPRLEQREVGLAVLVQRDDLSVDDGRSSRQPAGRVEERAEVARGVLLAAGPHADRPAVDHGLDAEPVPLHLEQPVGVIERGGDEGRQHRRDEGRPGHASTLRRSASLGIPPGNRLRNAPVMPAARRRPPMPPDRGKAGCIPPRRRPCPRFPRPSRASPPFRRTPERADHDGPVRLRHAPRAGPRRAAHRRDDRRLHDGGPAHGACGIRPAAHARDPGAGDRRGRGCRTRTDRRTRRRIACQGGRPRGPRLTAGAGPARRSQPEPGPRAVVKSAPRRYTAGTSHVLRGAASWYCNSNPSRGPISTCHSAYPDTGAFDAYAAAGPRLRAALGSGWRGRVVSVDGLRVKLVDWCQCYEGQSDEKVIDVYRDVYGVVGGSVTIRW